MSLAIHEPARLASDQRAVFDRLRAILSGKDADRRYNAIPESRKGRLISVDVARLVSPEFQTWDAKVRHTASTVNPAGAYAHDRLLRELAKPPANKSGTKRLVVTAGGAGSGKTSLLALGGGGTTDAAQADLIFDNQLRDFDRARQILLAAAEHGWEAEFWYVHRPFADTVRAVIERSQRTGRWNLLADLPRTHIEAQATIVRLRREFYEAPGIKFRAQYNASAGASGTGSQPARGSRVYFRDLKEGGVYHLAGEKPLLQMIPGILARAIKEGLICEELAGLIAPVAAASKAATAASKPKAERRRPKSGAMVGVAAGEEEELFPKWMDRRFQRAKQSSEKLAKARGGTLKVVKGVDMKGV